MSPTPPETGPEARPSSWSAGSPTGSGELPAGPPTGSGEFPAGPATGSGEFPPVRLGPPSPADGLPAAAPPARPRGLLIGAAAVTAALVVAAVWVVVANRGGRTETSDGGGLGGAVGGAVETPEGTGATLPSNAGTLRPTTTTAATLPDGGTGPSRPAEAVALPAPTIPAESSPPTTIPGSEPNSIPTDIFSGEEAPQFGTIVVDLEEGGYEDFAVHLRDDQEVSLLSLGDDGIETAIEVYTPDGELEGWWEGGEPGVVNGWEWYLPDDPLPATGTYVIRVVHLGGSHEPFALGFFGNA